MTKDEVGKFKVNITPGGATAMYDAVYFACREYMTKGRQEPKRRVLVVLSDGEDNQSRVSRNEAVAAAQASGTIVFTVSTSGVPPASYSIRTPFYEPSGKNLLGLLASETGGDEFTPDSSKRVSEAFRSIADKIARMYSVTFPPDQSAQAGAFRLIEVRIATDKKVKIQAPKGYYVPAIVQ